MLDSFPFLESWEDDFHFPKVHAELAQSAQPGEPPTRAVDKPLRLGTERSEARGTAYSFGPGGIVRRGHTPLECAGWRARLARPGHRAHMSPACLWSVLGEQELSSQRRSEALQLNVRRFFVLFCSLISCLATNVLRK